jgi:hypothetical protein
MGSSIDWRQVEMDPVTRRCTLTLAKDAELRRVQGEIRHFLVDHPRQTKEAIEPHVGGTMALKRAALRAGIDTLFVRDGSGKRGDPYLYSMKGDALLPELPEVPEQSQEGA